jgi:hypothetical protein
MPSNIAYLHWSELVLGRTHFFRDDNDPLSYIMYWNMAATRLKFRNTPNAEVDLWLETDIYESRVRAN